MLQRQELRPERESARLQKLSSGTPLFHLGAELALGAREIWEQIPVSLTSCVPFLSRPRFSPSAKEEQDSLLLISKTWKRNRTSEERARIHTKLREQQWVSYKLSPPRDRRNQGFPYQTQGSKALWGKTVLLAAKEGSGNKGKELPRQKCYPSEETVPPVALKRRAILTF